MINNRATKSININSLYKIRNSYTMFSGKLHKQILFYFYMTLYKYPTEEERTKKAES